jgi:LEA14-like dessication related protein
MLRASTLALLAALASPAGAQVVPSAAAVPAIVGGQVVLALRGCAVEAVEASGTTVAFTAELSNPTAEPVLLGGLSYALDVEGKRVFEGSVPGGVDVPAGGTASVPLPGRFRYADVPGVAAKIALKKAVPYRLAVAAAVRTSRGDVSIPVAHDGELSVPKLPGFGLAGLRIASMNPFDAAVEVKVEVENGNTFALPAGLLRYRITVAEGELASAEGVLPAIGPGAKAIVAIPVKLSVKKAGKGVFKALKGDAALVGLHGIASIGELAFPVDLEARLPTGR